MNISTKTLHHPLADSNIHKGEKQEKQLPLYIYIYRQNKKHLQILQF